jgi:hypothetical protein
LITLAYYFADAQSFYALRRERSIIASFGSGNASYFGDLKDPKEYMDPKFNLTAGLQYFVNPRSSARVDLTYFQLKGDDAKSDDDSRQIRNLSFTSGNIELALTGTVNLLPMGSRFYQRPSFNVYGFAGIAFLYTNPKAELEGKKYALQPLQTEDVKYSRIQPVIPYGLGVRIKAGPFFNVAIEGGYRLTFTDYLDDVSTVHPDKSSWDPNSVRFKLSDRRPELGLPPYDPGTQRGDPANDGYFLLTAKVEYYLPYNFLFKTDQRKLYNKKRKQYYRKRR